MIRQKIILPQLTMFIWISYCNSQLCPSTSDFHSLSIQDYNILSKGCLVTPIQPFSFNFPLQSLHSMQIRIDLNNSEDYLHISLHPGLTVGNHDLEIISRRETEVLNIPSSYGSFLLEIKQGSQIISFQNSSLTIERSLRSSSSYILTVHLNFTAQNVTSTNKTSFRFLYQCPKEYVLTGGKCERVCPPKQFSQNGTCTKCTDFCLTGRCLSEHTCNLCQPPEVFSKELNICVEKCPNGYFEDINNKICAKCSPECVSCSFPYGFCSATYFQTDILINLIIIGIVSLLIVYCAFCCTKEDPPTENPGKQDRQQEEALKPEHSLGNQDIVRHSRYEIFEDIGQHEEFDENLSVIKPRKASFKCHHRIQPISFHHEEFAIDDDNEEQAISHQSTSNKRTSLNLNLTIKTGSQFSLKLESSRVHRYSNLGIQALECQVNGCEEISSIQSISRDQANKEETDRISERGQQKEDKGYMCDLSSNRSHSKGINETT